MTTTETVADVATNIRRSVEYIEKKYPGAKTLDAAIILRNMKRWASQIESALASAEPVAWELTCHGTVQQIVRREDVAAERLAYWRTFDPDASCRELVYTHAQPAAKVEAPGYSLSDEQIATLLSEGLKPEEIGGTAEVQHARVGELVRWFARLATGSANPKWARPHAFELAYFVATNAGNRHIDINKVREAGFKEGAMVSPQDRGSLERIGFLQPMPAPTPASVPDGFRAFPDHVPDPDTQCVVLTAFAGQLCPSVDTWEMQREAPLSFSSASIETGFDWSDMGADVLYWKPVGELPAYPTTTEPTP